MTARTELDLERDHPVGAEPLLVPAVTLGAAARRHWWLVAVPVVVVLGIAFAAAYQRSPTYSADTRLGVGQLDTSAPANLAGFTSATQALAETYSRAIRGDAVVGAVARELRTNRDDVKRRSSAAPIPQTAVFRVTATGTSPEQAVRLANAASDALVAYTAREAASTPQSAGLLRAYRRESARLDRHRARIERLAERYRVQPTDANRRRLGPARALAAAVALRLKAVGLEYGASRHAPGSTALAYVIEHATGATSDRYRIMQLMLFVAGLAGLTIGLALALLRGKRAARRVFG
jgi:uncharacterized protein involved in exopolysaccharide biosynthesis